METKTMTWFADQLKERGFAEQYAVTQLEEYPDAMFGAATV